MEAFCVVNMQPLFCLLFSGRIDVEIIISDVLIVLILVFEMKLEESQANSIAFWLEDLYILSFCMGCPRETSHVCCIMG